jgi:hypothetical protein
MNSPHQSDVCLELPEQLALGARLASEIISADLNGDGKRDIVLSAPRYTLPFGRNEMMGIVFVALTPFPSLVQSVV